MGAGSFGAGLGHAGMDPLILLAPPPVIVTPRALKFDPRTKQFVRNADGQMADVHPIDQAVAFLLWVEQNSVPSRPSLGARVRARTARADPRLIPGIVTDEVTTTLRPLANRGDITLLSVVVDTATNPGLVAYAATYVNLRDPALNPRAPIPTTITPVL